MGLFPDDIHVLVNHRDLLCGFIFAIILKTVTGTYVLEIFIFSVLGGRLELWNESKQSYGLCVVL